MKSDQSYNGLIMHFKKELDELTTVWAQEEEKTSMMQKLLSSLFEEVHDMESHQNQIEKMVSKNKQDVSEKLSQLRRESVLLQNMTKKIEDDQVQVSQELRDNQ